MSGFSDQTPHRTITVQFIEHGSETPFAASELPPEQLPDTFMIETMLHIGDDDWIVVRAEPATKEEFLHTGNLELYLAKPSAQTVDPGAIRFSIPTLNNDLPPLEDAASLQNVFVVHEDDWRQRELVARACLADVERELEAIAAIYRSEHVEHGFRRVHVRQIITEPMRGVVLTPDELMAALGVDHVYSGLAFSSYAAVVSGGFAFRDGAGAVIWGRCDGAGNVAAVCVHFTQTVAEHAFAALDALLARHGLLYVDWIGLTATDSVTGLTDYPETGDNSID